jgi:hypothetical protein
MEEQTMTIDIAIGISRKSRDFLDKLKVELLEYAQKMRRDDLFQLFDNFDYDDLIYVLHLGFSEKSFFETVRGTCEGISFELSEQDLDEIRLGIKTLFKKDG